MIAAKALEELSTPLLIGQSLVCRCCDVRHRRTGTTVCGRSNASMVTGVSRRECQFAWKPRSGRLPVHAPFLCAREERDPIECGVTTAAACCFPSDCAFPFHLQATFLWIDLARFIVNEIVMCVLRWHAYLCSRTSIDACVCCCYASQTTESCL